MRSITDIVSGFKENWPQELAATAIERACRDCGMRWYESALNPVVTIQIFFLQVLHGNTACELLRHLTGMSFTAAAYCKARMRIKLEALRFSDVATLDTLYLANTYVRCTRTVESSRLHLRFLIFSGDRFTNDDAEWIQDLKELAHVQLRAPVTSSDVKSLASLPKLESLKVVSDQFTDDGLVHVSRLVKLRYLELECPVSDAGMEHLIPLKKLERLVCFAGPQASNLVQGLRESVRAKYKETPLVDAISVMSKLTGIAMRIDDAAFQAAGISASDVKLTVDEKGDLRQAFDAMLTPHGLACVGESGGLLITTREEAARRRPGTTRLLEANPKLEVYVPW